MDIQPGTTLYSLLTQLREEVAKPVAPTKVKSKKEVSVIEKAQEVEHTPSVEKAVKKASKAPARGRAMVEEEAEEVGEETARRHGLSAASGKEIVQHMVKTHTKQTRSPSPSPERPAKKSGKRGPSDYALAYGHYRKSGLSHAEAVKKAKEDSSK